MEQGRRQSAETDSPARVEAQEPFRARMAVEGTAILKA
jgi:hypothetical protein